MSTLVDTESGEQPADVGLDGVLGKVELPTELTITQSSTDPIQDLQLAWGDAEVRRDGAGALASPTLGR
jgi:hypothetical protein